MKATTTTTGHIPAPALHSISSSINLLSMVNEGNYVSILDIVASDLLELAVTPTFSLLPFPNNNVHTLCHCWVPYALDGTTTASSSVASSSSSPGIPSRSNSNNNNNNLLLIGQDRRILFYSSPYTTNKPIGEINVYFEIKAIAAITVRYSDICGLVTPPTFGNNSSSFSSSSSSTSPSSSSSSSSMVDESCSSSMKVEGDYIDDYASAKDLILVAIGGVNGVQLHFWSPSQSSTNDHSTVRNPSVMVPSTLPWPVMEMLPGYLISHITFSSSGKLLTIVAYDGHVGLWDIPSLLNENYRIREQRIIDLRKKLRNNAKLHIQHTHSILKSQGFATAFQSGKHGKHHGKGKTGLGKQGKHYSTTCTMNNSSGGSSASSSSSSAINECVGTSVPAVAHGVIRDGRITAVTISENDRFLALALHDGRVVIYGRCDERRDIPWLHTVEGAPDSLVGNNYNFTPTNPTVPVGISVSPSVPSPPPLPPKDNASPLFTNSSTVSSSLSTISSFSSRLRNLQTNFPSKNNNNNHGINSSNTGTNGTTNAISASSLTSVPRLWAVPSSSISSTGASNEKKESPFISFSNTVNTTAPPLPPNPPPPVGPVYQPQWWPPILAIDHTGAIAPMLGICDRPRNTTTTFAPDNTSNAINFSTLTNPFSASDEPFSLDLGNYILSGIENCTDTMNNNSSGITNRTAASKLHGPTLLAFVPNTFFSSGSLHRSTSFSSNDIRTGTLIIGNSRSQNIFALTIQPFMDHPNHHTSSSSPSFGPTLHSQGIHSPFHKSRSNSEHYSPMNSGSSHTTPTNTNNFTFTPGRQSLTGLPSLPNNGSVVQRTSSSSSLSSTSSSIHSSSLISHRTNNLPDENNQLVSSTLHYLSNDNYGLSNTGGISLILPHRSIVSATPMVDMLSPSLSTKSKYTSSIGLTSNDPEGNPNQTGTLPFTVGSFSSIKRLRMDEDDDEIVTNTVSVDELLHNSSSNSRSSNNNNHSTPSTSITYQRSGLSTNSNENEYRMQTGTVTKIPALADPDYHHHPIGRPRTPATNIPVYSATPLGILSIGNNITGLSVVTGRAPPLPTLPTKHRSSPSTGTTTGTTSTNTSSSLIRVAIVDSFGTMYILSPRLCSSLAMDHEGKGLLNRTSPGGGGVCTVSTVNSSSSPTTNIHLSFASPNGSAVSHSRHSSLVLVPSPDVPQNTVDNPYSSSSSNGYWTIIPCSKNYHLTITDALTTLVTAQQQQTERLIKSITNGTVIMNNSNGSNSSTMKQR